MALHNRAKAWLYKLTYSKDTASSWSEDNTDSIKTADKAFKSTSSVLSPGLESSHGSLHATDATHTQARLRSQVMPFKLRAKRDFVTW